jgi:alkanesulfonate monooxygenase SsuD/methylene tetrahydromethanopterin reductase-like flavin-dependent oxidoreductase (luciferase family)
LGDGWLASAYNTTPEQVAAGRAEHGVSCSVATMWTYVTDDRTEREDQVRRLAGMLRRPEEELAVRVMVGEPARCADLARRYADAGVDLLFVWPLAEPERQLGRVMREVVPLARDAAGR